MSRMSNHPRVAEAKSTGWESRGTDEARHSRDGGGGRTRFLEIVLLAGDRRKTEGKVPVVEIGVSPGPSPFLLPTERVGWGIRGGMAVGR